MQLDKSAIKSYEKSEKKIELRAECFFLMHSIKNKTKN